MKYYAQEGKYVKPPSHLRPHRFDIGNHRIPRAVLTIMHIPYGVGAPLYPWLRQLCEWFKVAPIQFSPNSYRSAIGLYLMYMDEGFPEPTMKELSHFFIVQKSGIGYFHLVVWRIHMSKGFNMGRISRIKGWKEKYFYTFDTERQPIIFRKKAIRHRRTELLGDDLARATKILERTDSQKNLNTLVTLENLKKHGFLPASARKPPSPKSKKQKHKKTPDVEAFAEMDDIPSIFTAPKTTSAANANPKVFMDPPTSDKNPQKNKTHQGKKQKINTTTQDTSIIKNPPIVIAAKPTPSRVLNEIGKIGDSLLSEQEYKKWMAKSREQKLALATRASLELLLFNAEQSSENKKDASRIKVLENENAKLKLDVNDAKNKASTLETTNTSLQNDLTQQKELTKEKDKSIAELQEKISNLQLNTEKLEIAKANWESDCDKKVIEAFGNGIRTYCKTFLAGEPNYNWGVKFGKSMAGFMADLAATNSEEIAEK